MPYSFSLVVPSVSFTNTLESNFEATFFSTLASELNMGFSQQGLIWYVFG